MHIGINLAASSNPLVNFIHEGTHALDDIVMKTHQTKILESLSKAKDMKKTLTDAQQIISEKEFANLYRYKEFFETKLTADFQQLQVQDVKEALKQLKQDKKNNNDSSDVLMAFSEFTAFAMEKLFDPWNYKIKNQDAKNLLIVVLKNVQKHFKNWQADHVIMEAITEKINALK